MTKTNNQNWHILHVDDDEDDHLIVLSMLGEACGRTVSLDWAPSLAEARLKLDTETYQAVLVDYDLGLGTGIDLIREAMQRSDNIPMILLTGRGSYEVDLEAMSAGATLYLTKTEINPLLLERSIRYAIERKQSDQALIERDRKLSVALAAAQLGAWTYSFEDHMLEMDERAQKMYRAGEPEMSHDEIVRRFLHPDDVPAMQQALESAADPHGSGRYLANYRILQADGSSCWLNAWGQVEFETWGDTRRAVRLIGASRDISWEKQAAVALSESEARFRDLANNISQLAWMMDENGYIFWYNQRWFDYTGTNFDEMQGMGWQKVHHPAYVEAVSAGFLACVASGEPWEDTFPLRGSDGQYRWFLSRARPIRDEGGKVVRWFGTNTDITDQLLLQEKNREQRDLLERLVQSAPLGIAFLTGPQHIYTLVNAAYTNIARGKGELVGHTVAEKWPEIADTVLPQMNLVFQTGEPFSITDTPLRVLRDGAGEEVFFTYTFSPIYKADGSIEGVMIIASETTEAVRNRLAVESQSAWLEAVLQSLPVGVWISDEHGRLVGKNEQADRIWAGNAPLVEGIDQYRQYSAWHPDTGLRLNSDEYPLARLILTGRPVDSQELNIRRFDGSPGTVLVSAAPVKDREGRLIGAVSINLDVTERRRMEQALRDSERSLKELAERFKAVLENSLDVAYRRDLRTDRYDYMSPVVEQVLGFTVEEMSAMPIEETLERVHPDDRPMVEAQLQQSNLHGRGRMEYRFRCKDGAFRWLADHITVQKDAASRPLFRTGIIRDVTERRRAGEALRISEERFRLASRAVSGVLYDWSISRDEMFQSEGLQHLVGYRPGEEPGGSRDWWPRNIHPEDYPRIQVELQAAIEGRTEKFDYEYRIRHRDGHWVHIWDQGYILRDATGQAQRVVGMCTDISDRVRADQSLKESERAYRELAATLEVERLKLAAAIETLPVGVGIGDAQGNTLSLNAAGLKLHGFHSEEEMFTRLDQYIQGFELRALDGNLLPLEDWPVSRALRGDYIQNYELILLNKREGNARIVSYSVAPVRSGGGDLALIVYVIQDLTERKHVEAELTASEDQLRTVIENLPQGLVVVSPQGGMLRWNRAALKMHGQAYLEDELSYMNNMVEFFEVYSMDGRPLVFEQWPISRVLRGETFTDEQFVLAHKKIEWRRIFSYSGVPIRIDGRLQMGILAVRDITVEKQLEGELRQALEDADAGRRLLEALMEYVPEGITIADAPHATIRMVSRYGRELLGGSHEQRTAENVAQEWKVFRSDGVTPLPSDQLPLVRAIRHGEVVTNQEIVQINAAGQALNLSCNAGPIRDAAGNVVGGVIAWRDITESKRAEEKRREVEERFRQLADSMPQLVWTATPQGVVDYYNNRYRLYDGFRMSEAGVWEWGPVLHPDDLERTVQVWEQAIRTGKTYQLEHRVRMADGFYRWHLSRGIPAFDESGRLVKWYGTATDIHDYKETQNQLNLREQRMRHLFEANLIGIAIRDGSGRIFEANDAYLHIIGRSRQEVIGGEMNVRAITPPEFHELDRQGEAEVLANGFCRPYEKEYIRKDGTHVPILIGYSMFENDQREFIGFVLDLSELKKAQAGLQDYAERLKRSNEELEDFAFVASHDLQEPLRKIQMFGSLLQRQENGCLSEEAQKYLDRMQNAAERMQAMVNGLLELSRVSTRAGALKTVDLTGLAQEILSDLEARIRFSEGQVIIDPLPAVVGDPLQLRQLLQNLIGNALKFHREGVPPVVRVSGEMVPDAKPPQARIVVADNGIGLEENSVKEIFKPFVRLQGRSQYEGSGMGLAICQKIVERHGGTLAAEGRPGEGSRFIITLPAAQNQ